MASSVEPVTVAPWDAHNQALVANVHPADWVNPKPAGRYNLVVIGAGTAGLITAAGAAGLGAKVALIEKHLYPTQAEAIKKVADAWHRTRLTPVVKKLLSNWLSWKR